MIAIGQPRRIRLVHLLIAAAAASSCLIMASPASAQMLGMTMARIAGPFAGRMAANGNEMAPLYGSQAGAMPHLMQGTQALMPVTNDLVSSGGLNMARSSEAAVPSMHGSTATPMKPGDPAGSSGETSAGAEAPDAKEVGEDIGELLIGACAGGAFIGAYAATTAAAPVAGTPIGVTVVASAMAVGCGLGVATAGASLGAVVAWRKAAR